MKQIIKRLTLTGDWTEFRFGKKARLFFVKNYTDGDILASFEQGTSAEAQAYNTYVNECKAKAHKEVYGD